MASSRSVCVLLCCLVLVPFAPPISGSDSGKVSLELYYESLCPYSANFVVNYLAEIFENGLISIVDLKLVPWGNARLRPNSTVVCQVRISPLLRCSNPTAYDAKKASLV